MPPFGPVTHQQALQSSLQVVARSKDEFLLTSQIMYPLDVVKTRQQLNVGKGGDGIWKTLTNIVREEG